MPELAGDTTAKHLLDTEGLLRFPVGAVSPLWGLFAGAAMTGVTWWMMTRWARPENLEALFGARMPLTPAPLTPAAPVVAALKAVIAPVVAPEPIVAAPSVVAAPEPTPEPAPEPILEATPEPTVAEVLAEADLPPAPVGGEAAPISPILAAEPEPVVETKVAAPAEPKPVPKPTPTVKAVAAAPREPRSVSPKAKPPAASKPV